MRLRRGLGRLTLAGAAVFASTCSSPTKPDPVVDLAIQSVSPAAGPATGGTEVTIRGTGFATGLGVTIGGRPASDVIVRGNDTATAKTPTSATAGAVDIAVTLNGRTGTLTGGFRYDAAQNTAPTIRSLTAQGKRVRQPPSFADYGETIQVALAVEDAESAAAQLTYQWRACGGTFVGTGPVVDWTAPPLGTLPSMCTIEVTVLDGPHALTRSVAVRLHNSIEEMRSLVLEFLEDFANSTVPAAATVRNFSDSCPGKAAELKDVTENRASRIINSHVYGVPAVTVAFGGTCKAKSSDACAVTAVEWNSTVISRNAPEIAKGISTISGVYRDSRWWLCDSLYDGGSSLGLHFLY